MSMVQVLGEMTQWLRAGMGLAMVWSPEAPLYCPQVHIT